MNSQFLDSLGKLIKTLEENKDKLIADLIPAKLTDRKLAEELTKEIQKIEIFIEEIIQADTKEKLSNALKKLKADSR